MKIAMGDISPAGPPNPRGIVCGSLAIGLELASMDQRLRRLSEELRSKRRVAEFSPAAVAPELLPHLFVLDIEPCLDLVRLRIRLVGTALDRAFRRQLDGLYLEDFIHGPRGADVLEGFHHCATARQPIWMRQVVRIREHLPRFVEGVAFYLDPNRLYGGLIVGELTTDVSEGSFETHPIY